MSMNYTGKEPRISPTEAEGVLFAATPAWERSRKTRRFGARKATQTVTEPHSLPPSATMTNSTLAADETPFAAAPALATRTTRVKKAGPSPTVIAMALGAVVVLGGVSFYALQPHGGVTTLTPGEPTTSELAVAPVAPDVDVATNTLPQPAIAAEPWMARPSAAAASSARVRPARAAAPSAGANSANVSATLPAGPQPYATVNPAAPAPIEAAPPVQEVAPAPAPSEPAPETLTPPTT